ncbi:uncharacterized protein LOC131806624 [Musca domestica]|uniref:Uncharacterized protein LOC131806624 n=1 Tax=Musca domestica TaxID=7370 RepID=A0ABM3VMM7_MUSDO|nr:uncharacterized protein LOC131806624 [Musca domestica]
MPNQLHGFNIDIPRAFVVDSLVHIPILNMACNGKSLVSEFCRLPIFRVFARLSPQIYLWHCLILQATSAYHRQPHYMNLMYYNCQTIITTVLSTGVAFFGYLLLEIPFAQAFEALMMLEKSSDKA